MEVIISIYMKINNSKVPFYFKNDATLCEYVTREEDLKHNISRVPKDP